MNRPADQQPAPRRRNNVPFKQYENLSRILAGMRYVESGGNWAGDYTRRIWVNGLEYFGAYGIQRSMWAPFSTFAGLKNAPMNSIAAQDKTVASVLQAYKERYGSWDMALIAWFMGPAEANKLMDLGGVAALSQLSPETSKYLTGVTTSAKEVPLAYLKTIMPDAFAQINSSMSSWIMPVAGRSEWSRGSYMAQHTKHSGSHYAIDIYSTEGTPIVSPVAGKVVGSGSGGRGGNWVRVLGNDGITYYFAHMAAPTVARKGDVVRPGYHLGYVGDTGSAKGTKPHLHFSMRLGNRPINPSQLLEGSAALAWNERVTALDPRLTEAEMDSTLTPQAGMLTDWVQGLSDTVASGQERELPELNPLSSTELRQAMAAAEQRDREAEDAEAAKAAERAEKLKKYEGTE
jgi:murein DD-endopeptidase MepM/ murein hydrolase activator NlpD